MKIRMGFVSNSSSSSFVVAKAVVGDEIFKKIQEIGRIAQAEDGDDTWFYSNENYFGGTVLQGSGFEDDIEALKLPKNSCMWGDC